MLKTLREEFRLSQLRLNHTRPKDFITAIWQQSNSEHVSPLYVIYRFMMAALFLSILVAHGSIYDSPNHFFIYLTNLGFVTQTLHLVINAAIPVQYLLNNGKGRAYSQMTSLAKLSWILYNTTNVSTILITGGYWGFIFQPGTRLNAMNFLVHAFICIASLSDLFIGVRPCRLIHFYQPVLFAVAYFIFSLIYWAAGGLNPKGFPYIYSITNWANPSLTVPLVVCTVLIFVPIIHTFVWVLHQIRDWLFLRIKGNNSVQAVNE